MRFISILFMLFLIVACSKPYEKYVGYWQLDGAAMPRIAAINKQGDVYLFNENILNEQSKELAMEELKDELAINNGFTSISLKLINNDSTLMILNKKYTKITAAEVDQIKKDIEDCKLLKASYKDDREPYVHKKFYGENPNKDKLDAVDNKYKELASKIPYCELSIWY